MFQAVSAGKGLEDPFDGNRSDGGESENGPHNKIDIIPALDICTLLRLVVRQLQKWGGVRPQRRVEVVKGEYHCEDSDADTYKKHCIGTFSDGILGGTKIEEHLYILYLSGSAAPIVENWSPALASPSSSAGLQW